MKKTNLAFALTFLAFNAWSSTSYAQMPANGQAPAGLIDDSNFTMTPSGSSAHSTHNNAAIRDYLGGSFSQHGCLLDGQRLTAAINPQFAENKLYLRGTEKSDTGASTLKVVYILESFEQTNSDEHYGLYFRIPLDERGRIDKNGKYFCVADVIEGTEYDRAFGGAGTTAFERSTTGGQPNRSYKTMETCASRGTCTYMSGGDSVGGALGGVVDKVSKRLVGNASESLVYGPANRLAEANRKYLDDLADSLFNFGDDEESDEIDEGPDYRAATSREAWGTYEEHEEE